MPNSIMDLDLTPKGERIHRKDEKKVEKLLEESDRLEKEFQEWYKNNQKHLNNSDITNKKRRELKKELRKFKKEHSSVISKLNFLLRKNSKEIRKELKRHGEINS